MNSVAEKELARLFTTCEGMGASDIHFGGTGAARYRVQGRLFIPEGEPELSADAARELGLTLIGKSSGSPQAAAELLAEERNIDGAITSAGGFRYRFNVFLEQGNVAVALRRLEQRFRSLTELGLSESLHAFSELRDGLVLVSGPTGSGKSTTLATLLDEINRTRECHIITIEDPIEYEHRSQRALVQQRQVGRDAHSFHKALVSALRQDPDVLLVGEMRDLDTIRTALTAAETGHLVFATLHAGDCVGAIERLVGVFPADEQTSIRRQLSLSLRGILVQHLLRCRTTKPDEAARRIPCSELLISNTAIANLIVTGRSAQIYSAIEVGGKYGMHTMDQDLARLFGSGLIDEQTALAHCHAPESFRDRVRNQRFIGKV